VSSRFQRIRSKTVYEGKLARVTMETFRHEDGEEVQREIVRHRGAVAVVAHDGERLFLVRQPREAIGVPDLLELPAGKLDVDGEGLEATARRELAEEIGMGARSWRHLVSFYNSPGLLAEENHLFLAEDLYDESLEAEENERIEIVQLPVERLDETIAQVRDAKTLIGLLWFRAYLR